MDLSFIPNMCSDIENIIFQYKQQLDDFENHKSKMKVIFLEFKKKLQCVKCSKNRQFHVFDENDINKYIRGPICEQCYCDLRCVDLIYLFEVFNDFF